MNPVSLPHGVAVVTGAAGGMGSQCARLMAEAGWTDLLLCDLDKVRLEAVAEPLRRGGANVATLAADMREQAWTGMFAEAMGARAIGALIHTAGVSSGLTQDRDLIFDVNIDAVLRLVEVTRPRMAQGAAAVLFASLAGHVPVTPEADAAFDAVLPVGGSASLRHHATDADLAYLLSKRAVIATVRREAKPWYRERKARIVSLSPGMVDTVMMQGIDNPFTRSLHEAAAIPRFAQPEEIAAVAVFLCSPAAGFLTGTDILVDGGVAAGLGV